MVVNIELVIAFDRVSHTFLLNAMARYGFDLSFIKWVKACISMPWITPLVNGRAAGFFQATRELRQGCSLSPLLYAIQASVLSLQLEQARRDQDLIGISMAWGTKNINHAQFADDTILHGGASQLIAKRFKVELDYYCQALGSKLNLRKSSIYSWNINPIEMSGISRILEIEGVTIWNWFKYLGIPIFKNKPKCSEWNPLMEKLKNKIISWGVVWLYLAGKLVIIKSVLNSYLLY